MRLRINCLLGILLAAVLVLPLSVKADDAVYTNPDTGYKAYIIDEADLLTSSEEGKLVEDMKPVTAYGNVMFLSTNDNNRGSSKDYAKSFYRQYFGSASGTIFLIDMDNRNIWIHSDGRIYRTVTTAYGNTITDNVYTYASKGDYYTCAAEAFRQEVKILDGGRIAQPMKYICNALIALVAGSLITFFVMQSQRRTKNLRVSKAKAAVSVQLLGRQLLESHVYTQSSGGSGGGGGFSGG
ncbi:MAG: TPM domain-containing protein, partial [Firmicutes bacterium]|nr:TPM domain-containing protein [Bacillota bacterium]